MARVAQICNSASTKNDATSSDEKIAVDLDGIICTLGNKLVLAIDHLRIVHGEQVAIIGHNGAGKSTLLRLLSGFVIPDRGVVSVLGARLSRETSALTLRDLRAQTGQVLQGLHLVQRLSALDNVLIGALGRLSGWRTWLRWHDAAVVAEAEACLRDVGLLAKADVRVDKLSGGERQKVAIARMHMQRARLILADEPTASLDPQAAAEICVQLGRVALSATLVSVVHSPALLPLLAQRVIGLRAGRIAFDLPVAQVSDEQLLALYRGEPEPQSAVAYAAAAAHHTSHISP